MNHRVAWKLACLLTAAACAAAAEPDPRLAPLLPLVGKTWRGETVATSRVLPDGRLHVRSRYLKDGQWADGHEAYYSVDPKAVVRFKD